MKLVVSREYLLNLLRVISDSTLTARIQTELDSGGFTSVGKPPANCHIVELSEDEAVLFMDRWSVEITKLGKGDENKLN